MTNDAWVELVARVKKSCSNVEEETLPLIDDGGKEIDRGTLHVVEFDSPDGKRYRLERERKPRVLSQHQSFSGRAGTAAAISYDVSDTEFTDHVELLVEDDYGEWQSVPLESLA